MNDLLGLLLSWPIILISTLTFLYWHFTKTYDHWKKRGVVFEKPILLFGNLKERMLFRQSFHEYQRDAYFKFEGHPYAGKKLFGSFTFHVSLLVNTMVL